MIDERIYRPFAFFQTNCFFGRIFNDTFGMRIGGIRFQPQSDVQWIFFFIFQNNEIVTLNKVQPATHQRMGCTHIVRIKLFFERNTELIGQGCVNANVSIIAGAGLEIRTDREERNGLIFQTNRHGIRIFLKIICAKKGNFIAIILLENNFTAQLWIGWQPGFRTNIPSPRGTLFIEVKIL